MLIEGASDDDWTTWEFAFFFRLKYWNQMNEEKKTTLFRRWLRGRARKTYYELRINIIVVILNKQNWEIEMSRSIFSNNRSGTECAHAQNNKKRTFAWFFFLCLLKQIQMFVYQPERFMKIIAHRYSLYCECLLLFTVHRIHSIIIIDFAAHET